MHHGSERAAPPIRAGLARVARRLGPPDARYGGGVAVLLVLIALASRLVLGPVHGVRDAAGCERAYAGARTRADSVSVAFLSYPDPAGRQVKRRCGELRAAAVDAPGR